MHNFTEYEETGLYEQDYSRCEQAKREPRVYIVNLVKEQGRWIHVIEGVKSINK